MPALAWPLIVARHVAVLPTLAGWEYVDIWDGPAVTAGTSSDRLTIGSIPGEDAVTSWERNPDEEIDGVVREDGTIGCQLVCAAGGDDVAAQRVRLAGLLDAWQEWLLVDNDQGGALLGNSRLTLSADVALSLTGNGATASAVIALTYLARTA